MCTKDQLACISEEIAKLANAVFGERLDSTLLYGSYARGDYDAESDVDIMVLANVPKEALSGYKKQFTQLTSELGLAHDIVVTVTLKDTDTFYRYLDVVPFYSAVKKEGIPIAV